MKKVSVLLAGLLMAIAVVFPSCSAQQADTGLLGAQGVTPPKVAEDYEKITDKYVDENKFVPEDKIDDYVNELYASTDDWMNSGLITYREKWDTYVYIKDSNGLGTFLMAPVAGYSSGGSLSSLSIYQPFHDDFRKSKIQIATKEIKIPLDTNSTALVDKITDYYPESIIPKANQTVIKDSAVTFDSAKSFPSNGAVLWDSHGTCSEEDGSCITLSTDFSKTKISKEDLDNKRVVKVDIYGKEYPALTPKFFDYYYSDGSLKNSLIFLGACYTATDRVFNVFEKEKTLSGILERKGAKAVYGSTGKILTAYIHQIENEVFKSLADGKTAKDALDIAKDKYGESYGGVEVILCGNEAQKIPSVYSTPTTPTIPSYTSPTVKPTVPPFTTSASYTYTNSQYGWSIDLTAEWNKYGAYIESGDKDDGNILGGVAFYHKETYNKHKMGYVFSIYATPIGSDRDDRNNGGAFRGGYLGKNDQYAFYWDGPTDLQVEQSDSDFKRQYEEYSKLRDQRDTILDSFKLAN